MQARMLEIMMNGVSTRSYQHVIPEMAESVGISKSSVSQETIEASEAALKQLLERRLDDKDFIVIYIDGLHCGEHCVIGAERGGVQGFAAELGRSRSRSRTATFIHHRWLEGLADRDQRRVWSEGIGTEVSSPQAQKCNRAITARPARTNSVADASGLEA